MTSNVSSVLLVGGGGVGTMAAYNLEKGGLATVTAVLRSNYQAVKQGGFNIDSIDHGTIKGWRPTQCMQPPLLSGTSISNNSKCLILFLMWLKKAWSHLTLSWSQRKISQMYRHLLQSSLPQRSRQARPQSCSSKTD